MVVNIIKKLQELGFSDYESRVYVHLVSRNPATPYEVAKLSGIPSSKIYEVLSKLAEKGLVMEINEGGKRRYVPMEPGDLVDSYRTRMEGTLGELGRDFSRIKEDSNVSYIWNIQSREDFLDHTGRMIAGARKNILLSVWGEELSQIIHLLRPRENDLKIAVVHFGTPRINMGTVFSHPIEDTLFAERGGRGFALVADGKEALVSTFFPDGTIEGAWSRNRGFCLLAEDYIKHDIYIMKIVSRFNPELISRFGDGYAKLRDVFRDEEEQ